jgi:hypothetical protein
MALPLGFEAVDALQWQHSGQVDHYADLARENPGRPPAMAHALARAAAWRHTHNLLDESEYIFLAPAWSVSLEWQFYLLAPFLVHAHQAQASPALLFIAYQAGLLGHFYLPSFLPGYRSSASRPPVFTQDLHCPLKLPPRCAVEVVAGKSGFRGVNNHVLAYRPGRRSRSKPDPDRPGTGPGSRPG